jgi:hypothetical protein
VDRHTILLFATGIPACSPFREPLLSKRLEDGEHPNVIELFDQLAERLTQLIADGYAER